MQVGICLLKRQHAYLLIRYLLISLIAGFLIACTPPYVPTGGWQGRVSAQCDAPAIEDGLAAHAEDAPGQVAFLQDFFSNCGDSLSRGSDDGLIGMYNDSLTIYDYTQNRGYHAIELNNMDGYKIHVELLLQQTSEPRPLIIVKCGLQCGAGDSSLRQMAMHIYDESPFHVLLVPNYTSTLFQTENQVLTTGGYEEGRGLLDIARYVTSSAFPYHDQVTSVHLMATSLGSHSALYTALYDEWATTSPPAPPIIQSYLLGCPVVDFQKSIDNLYQNSILGDRFYNQFWSQIKYVMSVVPVISQLLQPFASNPQIGTTAQAIATVATEHYETREQSDPYWAWPPFVGVHFQSENDFWYFNQAQSFASLYEKPMLVWVAKDDMVVSPSDNAEQLSQVVQAIGGSPVSVLETNYGNHCDFAKTYGWRTASAIYRSFFLSNSPEFSSKAQKKTAQIQFTDYPESFNVGYGRRRVGLRWQAHLGSKTADLINSMSVPCYGPHIGNSKMCKQDAQAEVDLSNLGIPEQRWPQNESEVEGFTRWLNTNLNVYGNAVGRLDPSENPVQVSWMDYQ